MLNGTTFSEFPMSQIIIFSYSFRITWYHLSCFRSRFTALSSIIPLWMTLVIFEGQVTFVSSRESPCSGDLNYRDSPRCHLSCVARQLEQRCSCRPFWSLAKGRQPPLIWPERRSWRMRGKTQMSIHREICSSASLPSHTWDACIAYRHYA